MAEVILDDCALQQLSHKAEELYLQFQSQQKSKHRSDIQNVWAKNRDISIKAEKEHMKRLEKIASNALYNRPPVHHAHNTRTHKARKDLVIQTWRKRVILPQTSRLPPARFYTYTPHNVLVEDQKALTNIPYFDDETASDGNEFIETLIDYHDGNIHSAMVVKEDEYFVKLVQKLNRMLNIEYSSIRSKHKPRSQIPQDIHDIVFRAISIAFPSEGESSEVKERYEKLLIPKKVSYNPNIDGPNAESVSRERSLHSFKSLFCRRCLKYDCYLHSAEMDLTPENLSRISIRKSSSFIEHTPKHLIKHPCSTNCYVNHLKDNPSKVPLDRISKADESIIRAEWSSSPGYFCFINKLIYKKSVTCHMVYFWCKKEISNFANFCNYYPTISSGKTCESIKTNCASDGNSTFTGDIGNSDDDESNSSNSNSSSNGLIIKSYQAIPLNRRNGHPVRSDPPKRKTSLTTKGHSKQRKKNQYFYMLHELKKSKPANYPVHNYTPCLNHIGEECSEDCSCVIKGHFCEKYCLCSSKCVYRFPGCKCTSNCATNQCPCFKGSRECDPDLCKACGAGDYPEPKKCSNVLLQRMKKKHLLIAPSDLGFEAGWGCFTKERILKNELISEYCGEVISQLEADRRGIIYDKYKISFLFQLNSEFSVDATVKGNKIRFANHSVNPNCYARVCKVNGEHRIGIFAKRDIAVGEELFFDYQYGNNERLIFVPIEKHVPIASRESHGPKNHNGKEGNQTQRANGSTRVNGTATATTAKVNPTGTRVMAIKTAPHKSRASSKATRQLNGSSSTHKAKIHHGNCVS